MTFWIEDGSFLLFVLDSLALLCAVLASTTLEPRAVFRALLVSAGVSVPLCVLCLSVCISLGMCLWRALSLSHHVCPCVQMILILQ